MVYCKYCYRMIDDNAQYCPACGKEQRKKLKFKIPVRIGLFFGTFLVYHIIIGSFFPVDENNILQAPDWYVYIGLILGILAAFFDKLSRLLYPTVNQVSSTPVDRVITPAFVSQCIEPKNIVQYTEQTESADSILDMTTDMSADMPIDMPIDELTEASLSEAESSVPEPPPYNAVESVADLSLEKEDITTRLQKLDEAQHIVNHTTDPQEFFTKLHFVLDTLMYLKQYEKYNLFETSTPSDNYREIILSRCSEVSYFIERAIQKNEAEVCMLETTIKKINHRLQFAEQLLSAFDNATSFWIGNVGEPHYSGNLYVDSNYTDVLNLYTRAHNEKEIFESSQRWKQERITKENYFASIASDLAKLDTMEGHDFEYWCADLLRKIGFSNVEVTQGSGDQGVDILAEKDGIRYAIQCKCYSNDLGNGPIQEVSAGKMMPQYHCQVGAVMTNRYFTKGAKDLAAATGTLLWDRDWIISAYEKINPPRASCPEAEQNSTLR